MTSAGGSGQGPAQQTSLTPPSGPPKFSDSARDAFWQAADQYVIDLTEVARLLMRRQGSDLVSENHIRTAVSTLASRSGGWKVKLLGALGGVLLGAGLGIVGSVLATDKPVWTTLSVSLSIATCTLGGAMLATWALHD